MVKVIGAFLVAFAVSFFLTPFVKKIAVRAGAIDKPDARKVHKSPIPRLGGLAIYAAFVTGMLLFADMSRPLLGLLLGATSIVLLGVIDDICELPAKLKLGGQIASALIFVLFDPANSIDFLTNPFTGNMFQVGIFVIPLTVFWIVGITNTINLIDGLDGLAAGVSSISAITLLIFAVQVHEPATIILTALVAGSSLGFLQHNFNPAKIFMGDTGSMFLGFVLAAVSVQGTMKSAATIALMVPLLALGLPILDTSIAILRRFFTGKPIFKPDKNHLHHRLLALGFSQKQVVLMLYAVSGFFSLSAIAMFRFHLLIVFPLAVCFALLAAWGVYRFMTPPAEKGQDVSS